MKQGNRCFWMLAYTFFVIAIATNIPSPLYSVYRHLWGLSSGTVALVFAIYSVFLIPSLLVFGQLSDVIGRKKVLIAGISLVAIGCVLFSTAHGLFALFAAQIVQGTAAGMLNGVTTAALVELHPRHDYQSASFAATVSMAVGTAIDPLLGGVLAEYAPYPTALTYVAYLVLLVAAIFTVLTMPETIAQKPARSWRIERPSVPISIRKQFTISSITAFLCWAIMALFMTLIPAYVNLLLHVQSLVVAGGVTFVIFASSSTTQLLYRRMAPQKAMGIGLGLLVLGLVVFIAAVHFQSLPMLFAGAVIDGVGHGLSFLGSMALVALVAPADKRGSVISGLYVWSYAGVGWPVVGVGFLAERFGLYHTIIGFSGIVGVISLVTAWLILHRPTTADGHYVST